MKPCYYSKLFLIYLVLLAYPVFAEVNIESDLVEYDKKRSVVRASGNVVVVYEDNTLTAEIIEYKRSEDTLIASGTVVLKRGDGVVYSAEKLDFNYLLDKGSALNFSARVDHSYLKANEGSIRWKSATIKGCFFLYM